MGGRLDGLRVSLASRLVHRLAIVSPSGDGDPDDLADLSPYGDAETGTPTTELVRGLVQPRTTKEIEAISASSAEVGNHVIFLLRRRLAAGAYITDADDAGVLSGGRRFEVVGVRDFDFGRSPHLEVDCNLVGPSEAPIGS